MSIMEMHQSRPGLSAVVAKRVRGLMAELELTQLDLVPLLGISNSGISKRVRGQMQFGLDELPQVATALGTSIEYLLGLTDERSPRRSVPGGGSLFLPWESGTPSGTRTPNPLNKAASQLADVVELRPRPRSSATSTRGAVVVDLSSRRVS